MRVQRFSRPESLAAAAAADIADAVRHRPDLLLCAPTGASPTLTYAHLAQLAAAEPGLFRRLRLIALDEWGGLEPGNPATCGAYLQQHLLAPLELPPERVLLWSSRPADPVAECARVACWLETYGPIDFCLLGLGLNGHLGLNEPAETHPPGPHVARLAAGSLQHGMLRASAALPAYGLTLGLADLLRARQIRLLVSGAAKRPVLAKLLEPVVSPWFPASYLWLHPAVRVLATADAWPDP